MDSTAGCEVSEVVALLEFDSKVPAVLQFDRRLFISSWMALSFFCFLMANLDTGLTY